MTDNLKYEKELYAQNITLIGGIDEVGRGPLAGPVVASCVILPVNYSLEGLTDSKKLTESQRNKFFECLQKDALAIGIGVIDERRIDEINILEATKLAMLEAIEKCPIKPEYLLIDGKNMKLKTSILHTSIIKGDNLSLSIAAASVIAKVTRDQMMYELDKKYPQYGFAQHKGYPTPKHCENLMKYGVLDIYRFTFAPVRDLIKNSVINEKHHKKTH